MAAEGGKVVEDFLRVVGDGGLFFRENKICFEKYNQSLYARLFGGLSKISESYDFHAYFRMIAYPNLSAPNKPNIYY